MKIIQVSDLHMAETTDLTLCKRKVDMLYDAVKGEIKQDEDIIFCCCGDVTDSGNEGGYIKAEDLFTYITTKFRRYKISFEFVPGNHDLVSADFKRYDSFIEKFIKGTNYKYQDKSVWSREYGNFRIILANSSYRKDYKYGAIDLASLKAELSKSEHKVIIVTHHTLISSDEGDQSSIRNSYQLIDALTKAKVIGLLHGHTHGYSDVVVGKNCRIVGVGPLLKTVADVPNQLNFINIVAANIDEISNFDYRADRGCFNKTIVYKLGNLGYFEGSKVKDVYRDVLESTKAYGCINNFNLHIETKAAAFYTEIETLFARQIPVAQQWQEKQCPETLYYNHGQYFDKGKIEGLAYIIKELIGKATSSRAILPLVNVEDVKGSGDGFFPSLDIMQFGFNDENKNNLHVTVYLRALEVNHFLKINLAEIYLMAKKIQDEIRSVSDLTINIIAFRAQYKETFGCFQRADIDRILIEDLVMHVSELERDKIISLLKNKLELSETVIIETGVTNLCNSIERFDAKHRNKYSKELIEGINRLKSLYLELKQRRVKTSIYKDLKENEDKITAQMQLVIDLFEKMEVQS